MDIILPKKRRRKHSRRCNYFSQIETRLTISYFGNSCRETMPPSQTTQDEFEKYVMGIVTATLKNGGTASRLDDHQLSPPVDAWEFPKYPARTVILPAKADLADGLRKFITANESLLREPDCWLGTWINPQTGCFYLDITIRCEDLGEAKRLALEFSERAGRRIVALYNSWRRETVYL